MSRVRVTWTVSDGYVDDRPHSFHVDADDFQHCDTDEDIEQLLYEIAQEHFVQRVTFSIRGEAGVIKAIKALKEKP